MSAPANSNKHMRPSEQQNRDDSSFLLQQYPIFSHSSLSPHVAALFTEQIVPALAKPGGAAEEALRLFSTTPPFMPTLLLEHNPDLFHHMVPFLDSTRALALLGSINHAFHDAVDEGVTSLQFFLYFGYRTMQPPSLARRFPFLTELSVEFHRRYSSSMCLRPDTCEWQQQLLLNDGLHLRLTKLELGDGLSLGQIMCSLPWPRLGRLSLPTFEDVERLIPQRSTENGYEPQGAPPASTFPVLQVLTIEHELRESRLHFLAEAIRQGILPQLCVIEKKPERDMYRGKNGYAQGCLSK